MKLEALPDLAYSRKWGNRIRIQWKKIVLARIEKIEYYPKPKPCKRKACEQMLNNPCTTFKHIRDVHLKKKTCLKFTVLKSFFCPPLSYGLIGGSFNAYFCQLWTVVHSLSQHDPRGVRFSVVFTIRCGQQFLLFF